MFSDRLHFSVFCTICEVCLEITYISILSFTDFLQIVSQLFFRLPVSHKLSASCLAVCCYEYHGYILIPQCLSLFLSCPCYFLSFKSLSISLFMTKKIVFLGTWHLFFILPLICYYYIESLDCII